MSINLQPNLVSELIELRALRSDDWDKLFAVASDPLIWEQHPARDRYQEKVFRAFFNEALDEINHNGGAFVVIEKGSGRIIGSTRYHGLAPDNSVIEVGWTFLARKYWGGRYNGEMKRLMLDYIFQFVERVIFLVGVNNIRSQTAVKRLGAIDGGIVEKVQVDQHVSRSVRFILERSQWRSRDGSQGAQVHRSHELPQR